MESTICPSIVSMKNRSSEQPAIKFKSRGQWKEWNWNRYFCFVEKVAASLLSFDVEKGDRVGIFSNTRKEWSITDLAILGVGAVTVPIYQNSTDDDVKHIINSSKVKILFVENLRQFKKWKKIKNNCPSVIRVICFDDCLDEDSSVLSWDLFLTLGEELAHNNPDFLTELCAGVNENDIATIVFTSGTTGLPKGVVLTHKQIYSEINETFKIFGVDSSDTSLSFLPYAHILGRIEHLGHVCFGFTMAFAESFEKVVFNLRDIKPTILLAVPRIFEKLYLAIEAKSSSNPLKHKLFKWAKTSGRRFTRERLQRNSVSLVRLAQNIVIKKVLLKKVREVFGDQLRFAVSGGAPLNKEISEFFYSAGILILEGYGLTETTGAVCVNTPFDFQFGTVGKPLGDVEVKIAEDGEILIRSAKVMKEYLDDPLTTDSMIKEGWFHTGDVGEFGSTGFLKITDRKKDLIKTAGGKYVAPQKLEELFKRHPLISHSVIHGDRKKYIVALLTLDSEWVKKMVQESEISFADYGSLTQSSIVRNQVRKIVSEVNSHLASFEMIKNFAVLPSDFTVDSGELTPSLKVKRKYCDQKYRETIDSLYGMGTRFH